MFGSTLVQRHVGNTSLTAEFHEGSGRLRISSNGVLSHEFFPPQSWMIVATSAGASNWGTRPSKTDLLHVLEQFDG
ncbi:MULTISPECIES: hypothetical protein [Burkholderia]|uniref:Uncharacterized protein n=1 Tax=Burkholderia diffusa TaxID=488732 RepID=A0A6P2PPM4_9BURK|nr:MULTISPECIES: hypothetical protein [Burkholderia]KAB0662423.1 hypothetical protein F7R23_03135 [Burkholderia diffusa]MBM2655873.1 hypothetical protein [Burkholderia diffusa]MBN3729579.1 hypothetical protein [Burkholderia sp. Tr-20390]RQZ59059.1 hypothetical protein DIE08_32640 [Burkholderia sp. Bp9004]VWC10394.1 hypothetical protein BDI24065_05319 [Burkholderia diffusa]